MEKNSIDTKSHRLRKSASNGKPTKYDKRRECWAVIALLSLAVSVVFFLLFFLVEINAFTTIGAFISFAIFVISFCRSGDIDPDEPVGSSPWWWGL